MTSNEEAAPEETSLRRRETKLSYEEFQSVYLNQAKAEYLNYLCQKRRIDRQLRALQPGPPQQVAPAVAPPARAVNPFPIRFDEILRQAAEMMERAVMPFVVDVLLGMLITGSFSVSSFLYTAVMYGVLYALGYVGSLFRLRFARPNGVQRYRRSLVGSLFAAHPQAREFPRRWGYMGLKAVEAFVLSFWPCYSLDQLEMELQADAIVREPPPPPPTGTPPAVVGVPAPMLAPPVAADPQPIVAREVNLQASPSTDQQEPVRTSTPSPVLPTDPQPSPSQEVNLYESPSTEQTDEGHASTPPLMSPAHPETPLSGTEDEQSA